MGFLMNLMFDFNVVSFGELIYLVEIIIKIRRLLGILWISEFVSFFFLVRLVLRIACDEIVLE